VLEQQDEIWWTGRFPELWRGGCDGWNTPRRELVRMLETRSRAVILDVPSFPWPLMMADRLDTPLVLRLPDDLDAVVLSQLLGAGVFGRLTPYDRLIHSIPQVRARLSEEWELPAIWLTSEELLGSPAAEPAAWHAALRRHIAGSGPADRLGKTRHNQVLRPALKALEECFSAEAGDEVTDENEVRQVVALAAPARYRPGAFYPDFHNQTFRLERFEVDGDGLEVPLPTPDAAVVLLADEGQDPDERRNLLGRAARLLPPRGLLIVVGHVVTEDPNRPNPSIAGLVDDVLRATGGAVHLEELASLHWAAEPVVRGVMLRFTNLLPEAM
jgi:hypothetical protein